MSVWRQPDPTTCGPCCVLRARMLVDPAYDAAVRADPRRFADDALALAPRLRTVWPRALGTTPWALADALGEVTGRAYEVDRVGRGATARAAAWEQLHARVSAGALVGVYVGSPALPRHVVLAHAVRGDAVVVYEPGSGADRPASRDAFVRGRLPWGWPHPWALVAPAS